VELPLAALGLAIPLLPLLLGFVVPGLAPMSAERTRRWVATSALGSLGLALATALLWAGTGSVSRSWLEVGAPSGLQLALGVYLDGLTVALLLTVTGIGAVVARYTVRYLDGDPGQARFCRWLAYTLGSVLLFVVVHHLLLVFAAWVSTSLGLHRLLTFYRGRPAARLAARKKFLVSRLGDVFLLAAFLWIHRVFGTFEYGELFARVDEIAGAGTASVTGISLLLALGAMTKSAQIPFHTWLPDTMETPTPVSALMHAGIVNAGGFLLVRLSPVLVAAPVALALVAVVGALTAVFAAVVMLTQTDIKRKLGYSTVSQMGFMMLQCGLGAFPVAVLHIVGHSFYKGYAFLSAGSVVDPRVPASTPRPAQALGVGGAPLLAALALGAAVVGAAAGGFALAFGAKPGLPVLGAVLALAVAQLLVIERQVAAEGGGPSPRRLGAALRDGVALTAAYFALAALFDGLLSGSVAAPGTGSPGGLALAAALVALFAGAFALQLWLPRAAASQLGRRLYVHAYNGFYLGALEDRLVQRIWPVREAA